MTRRTYDQFCPVAKALDVVGERWTLLIVRELLVGPRRYTDLQSALPGLAANLLAERLKQLESAGLVTRGQLPPPAASSVYVLTSNGREDLLPIIGALARFGVRRLGEPGPDESVRVDLLAFFLTALPGASVRTRRSETYELRIGERAAHVDVGRRRVSVVDGLASEEPDLTLTFEPAAAADLLTGRRGLRELRAAGQVVSEGAEAVFARADDLLSSAIANQQGGSS